MEPKCLEPGCPEPCVWAINIEAHGTELYVCAKHREAYYTPEHGDTIERIGEGVEIIKAPGGTIIKGQEQADYFADPGIGRTDLLKCLESPAKFKAGEDAKAGKRARLEEEGD